jgi:RNA polymerase sigma factor (sigma-70 family)
VKVRSELPDNRITDRTISEQVSESHPGCSAGTTRCGHPVHRQAAEIRQLALEQRSDDRPFIQHAADGRTATSRVGSVWVSYLPADPGATESQLLWPEPDEIQRELSIAVDAYLSLLTQDERDLVLLRFQNRVPLRDIGDELGYSKDTAARLIAGILVKLRRFISSHVGADSYAEAREALVMMVEEAA